MTAHQDKDAPMGRADMVMLESALRNGWPIPDDKLRVELRRVQAVLDDCESNDRARWRAKRILELAKCRPAPPTRTGCSE
jgi:hypothetical protein